MMLPKKKRHNPLDVKGSSDFSLLSKLWRGQERSRAHPRPVDAALDSDTHWHWTSRGAVGGPAAFSQRPGSSGGGAKAGGLQCAPRSSSDVLSKPGELRAPRGGRQLPGRSAVPHFPLPSSGAGIPSASWGVFPRQGGSMVFPRRSCVKSRNIPHVTKKAARLVERVQFWN